jgi:hypothetical protein
MGNYTLAKRTRLKCAWSLSRCYFRYTRYQRHNVNPLNGGFDHSKIAVIAVNSLVSPFSLFLPIFPIFRFFPSPFFYFILRVMLANRRLLLRSSWIVI